jgi:hypothetical protein
MGNKLQRFAFGPLACTAWLAALTAPSLAADPVTIQFAARAGDQPVTCGQAISGIGASAATVQIQDFRIYVSAVRLVDRQGAEHPVTLTPDGVWQGERVALLDFEGGDVGGLTGVGGAEPSGYGTDEEDASGDEG